MTTNDSTPGEYVHVGHIDDTRIDDASLIEAISMSTMTSTTHVPSPLDVTMSADARRRAQPANLHNRAAIEKS